MLKKRIVHNRAMCLLCHTVIESVSVHDFQTCLCGAIHIDGGHVYLKRGANDMDNFLEMSEFEEIEVEDELV